jgi:hypothetical protein
MPHLFTTLFLLAGLSGTLLQAQSYKEVIVPFYSESIRLAYNPEMLSVEAPKLDDEPLIEYFHQLSNTPYDVLLGSLRRVTEVFHLNDWMYYQLMGSTLKKLYGSERVLEIELAKWFLLSQSGFDTRLGYLNGEVFVFVHVKDDIFETPMIEDRKRTFINLSSIGKGKKKQEPLFLLNFAPNPRGKAFSFKLRTLPGLRPDTKDVRVKFLQEGQWESIDVTVDQNVQKLMSSYPIISEREYINIPFSSTLAKSLIPELKRRIAGKSDWEAVSLLAAFTRSAFEYKEDKEYFGISKPMAAEELFLYPYSDCEDRSALFYNLVDSLLGLPMVVIAYTDHLTIGVALPQTRPGAFLHEGKAYYICDPTGPMSSSQIGVAPQGYERAPFKILMTTE